MRLVLLVQRGITAQLAFGSTAQRIITPSYVNVYCCGKLYRVSEKDCTLFFIFFSRCPVCGEWCKLHGLLLDTPTFD
jgi:hypothetical protein